MSDRKLELDRRKVLMSMGTVGAAGAMGAGTWARFTDTETKRVNVEAGSLDLKVGGEDGVINVGPLGPLSNGQCSALDCETITNAGSTPAEAIKFKLRNIVDYEMGRIEPEADAGDTSAGDPGKGNGELSGYLKILGFLKCKQKKQDGTWKKRFHPVWAGDNDACQTDMTNNWGQKDPCYFVKNYGVGIGSVEGQSAVRGLEHPLSYWDECKFCFQVYFENVTANDAMTDKTKFDIDVTLSDHAPA